MACRGCVVTASAIAMGVTIAVVAWLVIGAAMRTPLAARLADRPNERSLHAVPRPRVGGLGAMLAALPVAAWVGDEPLRIVVACAAALCIVSAVDDLRGLPATVRLAAHFAAAAVAVQVLAAHEWTLAAGVAAVFAIAWMTNLFNFMDGSDGLAGGMAVVGFGAYALMAWPSSPPLALACLAVACASAGFLARNFPPAAVFLGDAGSIPLGFLAGALGLYGVAAGAWAAWFPVVVFSPFILDATLTFARRVLLRQPVWRAHRSHYYQRLILSGWSHRRLALHAYAWMLLAAGTAFGAGAAGPVLQCGIIAVWVAACGLLLLAIERRLRRVGGAVAGAPGRSVG